MIVQFNAEPDPDSPSWHAIMLVDGKLHMQVPAPTKRAALRILAVWRKTLRTIARNKAN